MSDLPLDTSDPEVRLALAHIRLQVLTPVSVLVNIATCLICALVINPSLRDILHIFPTPLTPKPAMLALAALVVFGLEVLYSILLIIATKRETKKTLVHGVGLRLVFVNWFMACWAVAWSLQQFIASTVFLSLNVLLLAWIYLTLLSHPPSSSRPIDFLAIHIPTRTLLAITFLIGLPQSIFVMLHWGYPLEHPNRYADYQWEAFGVLMGTNFLGLVVVLLNTDVVWAVAGVWCMLSEIVRRPKAAPVFVTCVVFAALYPLAWAISALWTRKNREEHRIALEGEDEALRQEITRVQAERIVEEQQRQQQGGGQGQQKNGVDPNEADAAVTFAG